MRSRAALLLIIVLLIVSSACTTSEKDLTEPVLSPVPEDSVQSTEVPQAIPEDAPDKVVFSEILVGVPGKNNFEFIELYNTSAVKPFDMQGWSIWYKLADDQEASMVYQWSDEALIPPHGHYLLGRDGEDIGISSNQVFVQSLIGPKGGLQLRGLDDTILDSITWGTGPDDFSENEAVPSPGIGESIERAPGGNEGNAWDTDNNKNDFGMNAEPNPQNTGSPVTPLENKVLKLAVFAPDNVKPGSQFEYQLSVSNNTGQEVHGISFRFPIPADLNVISYPEAVDMSENIAVWNVDSLKNGKTVATQIVVGTPWTYLTALLENYSVSADDWPQLAFGAPIRTNIEGGVIPVGTLRSIIGAELTIEGIATMYTGGYFAGTGNVKFYMEDESGGAQVWVPGGEGRVDVQIGDLVRAHGKLELYRGAVELITGTPDDIEIISRSTEASNPPPTTIEISQAINDITLAGKLVQIEGLVSRAEEFTYSYEIDLIDDNGESMTLYIDKLTEINVELVEAGQRYVAAGILEIRDTSQQIYPRIQSDLRQVFPPVLLTEISADNTIESGNILTVTVTAINHTADVLHNVYVTATLPKNGSVYDSVLDGGVVTGNILLWNIDELEGDGSISQFRFKIRAQAEDGYITIPSVIASADEWPTPAESAAHNVFIGSSVPIWAIQGPGDRSPYILDRATTAGTVTGIFPELGGFWIQEQQSDSETNTSAGLFINTNDLDIPVEPGDNILVTGTIREASKQTQLVVDDPTEVKVKSSGNPLPAAVDLDPPTDDDSSLIYMEMFEGMLVQITGTGIAVSPTSKYGEYVVVRSEHSIDRLWQGKDTGAGIMVDDGSSMVHEDNTTLVYTVNTGDQVSSLIGPLAYTFGMFKIEPITVPDVIQAISDLPIIEPLAAGEFSIMTWNVENLFDTISPHPSDPPMPRKSQYLLQISKVVNTIIDAGAPTIIGLQEVENIGILEDIAMHEALSLFGYEPLLIDGTDSRGIDNGYLVRSDMAAVINIQQFVAPEGLTSRPPLMIEVEVTTSSGKITTFVLNNHFTSMSAGVEATEPRRNAQAEWNASVLELISSGQEVYAAVIGDLNSFYESKPIDSLRASGLFHTFDLIPEEERYTYIYQGASQVLDHIMVSESLYDIVTRVVVLHVNADYAFSDPLDDSPQRKSDHDPVIVVFTP